MKRKILSMVLVLVLCLSLTPMAALAEGEVTVTLFTTNDLHGVVEGDGAIGIATAAAIKASTPNALLIDAGDATQGASFATISQGEDMIYMMNIAGYDVMAAGNHEFDYGTDRLLANADAAAFPVLSANVTLNGEAMLPGSAAVEVANKSIGFIGLTTADTSTSTNPAQLKGVEFGSEVDAAKREIAALADETDAIVIVCHLGNNANASNCTSTRLLDALSDEELAEVAAVVDGHSHTVEKEPYIRGDMSIPVIQTGTMDTALGRIDLTFDGDAVTAAGSVISFDDAMTLPLTDYGVAVAEEVRSALDSVKAAQAEILDEVLCTNELPLWGGYIYWDYAESRIVEVSYGDFVTDAFAAFAEIFALQNALEMPIIAVENGGGISATLPMGQVTRGDVLNAFNHGNMVEVLRVTPAQLFAVLESGLGNITGQDETGLLLRESVSGSFPQINGFSFTYDPGAGSGAKIRAAELDDGTALVPTDKQTTLLLATNSYVSAAFTAAGAKKLGELGGEDQIVMEFIQVLTENGTKPLRYTGGGDRIRIEDDKSPETYTAKIPVLKAADGETALPGMTVHLSVDGAASVEYTTDEEGNLVLTLPRGPHMLCLEEAADGQPVYVNNYSGSGTVTTKEGYYRLGFLVDAAPAFTDVDPDAWYAGAVDFVNEKGLMSGYGDGTFAPGDNVSRAMFATILCRMEGSPVVNYLMTFTDVGADLWYTEAVRWAASEGIVDGYGDGTFVPGGDLTRQQFATMLYRYEQSRGGGLADDWMFLLPDFNDRDQVAEWAYEAMCWATVNGIVSGRGDGILDPGSNVTRAEAAAMLMRYCESDNGQGTEE